MENQEYVFSPFYFPPIRYMAEVVQQNTIIWDGIEHFQKQTYRNRCHVVGANGLQKLVVPTMRHGNSRHLKDLKISYAADWQKEHFKTLEAAYRRSPYFEYYEYVFELIFTLKEKYLIDLNHKIMEQILKILQTNVEIRFTETYREDYPNDCRNSYLTKSNPIEIPNYSQVFEEKLGFVTDLSIIDLICNLGPESIIYLKKYNS